MTRSSLLALALAACQADPSALPAPVAPPPDLTLPTLVFAQPASLLVSGLAPGDHVYVAASLRGIGRGPCLPALGGVCLGIRAAAVVVGDAIADANGEALVGITLPATVPDGTAIAFQAVVPRGPNQPAALGAPTVGVVQPDWDGDGFAPGAGGDCDDFAPTVYPGARERAINAVDDDCDGWLDELDIDDPGEEGLLSLAQGALPLYDLVVFGPGVWPIRNADFEATVRLVGEPGAILDLGGDYLWVRGGQVELESLTLRNGANARGGCVEVEGGALTLRGVTVTGCAGQFGGAIWAEQAAAVHLEDSLISDNIASQSGGGVLVYDGSLSVVRTLIVGNDAAHWGGGVMIEGGATATFTSSIIADNHAAWDGGGLQLEGPATLVGVTVVGNRADRVGGGLHAYNLAPIDVDSSVFWGNTAVTGANNLQWATGATGLLQYTTTGPTNNNDLSGSNFTAGAGNQLNLPGPVLRAWSDNGAWDDDDLRLLPGAPPVDTANPALGPDADGSPGDRGAYGLATGIGG